jgi:hypothetical protein
MNSINDAGINLKPDPDLIRAGIQAVHPAGLFEVRILKVRDSNPLRWYGKSFNGFYDSGDPVSLEAAVRNVAGIDGRTAPGVYFTINELDPVVRGFETKRLIRWKEVNNMANNAHPVDGALIDFSMVKREMVEDFLADDGCICEQEEHILRNLITLINRSIADGQAIRINQPPAHRVRLDS